MRVLLSPRTAPTARRQNPSSCASLSCSSRPCRAWSAPGRSSRFRNDCGNLTADAAPIDFLYPHAGTSLYIPLDLGAKKGRAVFEAVHREPGATLFWHLDDRYLGSTETFHQQALDIAPGVHVVTVVDGAGNRLSRRFEVLGESR